MNYPFFCPKCNYTQEISMRITEYVATGHKCPACNTEMKRDPQSLVCGMSIDTTGGFYRRCN